MVQIIIDGTVLEVEEGKNVLECALENGIYIPHLCHHKDLNPLGSCRMCIVEVKGGHEIIPSCTLKAKEGLIINTKSPEIERLRLLALELLLSGHPEDCSTCPKYGQCELQTLIQYFGPKTGRLKHRVKGFKTNDENPLIVHDMNRCILCGRCVRACNELRGVKVLQYQKAELETYVGTLHNKLLIESDCRFCGACVEVCPTGTIRDKLSKSGVPKEEQIVPCKAACPAHTDIPRYIRYVKDGKYDEAAAVIRERVPFPYTLGLVCTHVCELECKRKDVFQEMSIREIKRYAAEKDTGSCWKGKGKQLSDTGKKVCVVGAGPAGLTAAYYLRKQGHEVTVKEALPAAGGMMRFGIPSYRLPRYIVENEIQIIIDQGVKLELNTKVEMPEKLLKKYDAVIMAIGGHQGVRLPMDGNNLNGALLNVDFLRKASLGESVNMGEKVIVLGGGNVAFDCARTAKRLGAKEIHIACLEERAKMTASTEEIEEAQEEGIQVHSAQTFERITGEDKVTGVDFMNVKSFTFDENRRAIIEREENSIHHIEANTVIFAVGQRPDLSEANGLDLGRGNCIVVKDLIKDKSTSIPGIFAAGDAIYGTQSVIMAIESGREVAMEVDHYLGGDGDITEVLAPVEKASPYIGRVEGFASLERINPVIDDAKKREDNFDMYHHGICDDDICKEAGRCLNCDLRLQIERPRIWMEYGNEKGKES